MSTNKNVSTHIWGPGYVFARLKLNKPGKSRLFSIHRLVGWHFVPGYTEEKCIINHIDGDKTNNHYYNLEWCTQSQNMKHAHYTGLCVTRYGDQTNRHFVNSETVEKICELLIKHNGSIKPVLDIILSEGIYCTFGIIESIKSKETWVEVSDKYFTKDYFKDKRISEIERICESIIRHSGKTSDIVAELKDDMPHVTNKFINSLKDGSRYRNITIKYFKPNQYKKQNLFTENQVIQICESIVNNKGDINRVYKELKDSIGDNLTIVRIRDIKGKGSYMNISDQYFSKGEFPSRVIDIDNIDFVRSLLILNVFKGSPSAVYDALNHDKYPKLTKSVVSMIKYQYPAYMVSNRYDLVEYYTDIEQHKFRNVSKELIDTLIASYDSGNSDITDESYDVLLEQYVKEHGESSRPFTRQKQSSAVNDIVGTLTKCYFRPMHQNQIYYKDYIEKKQWNFNMCLQPKFDGCSVAYDVVSNRFFTRGDYDNGESLDVTKLFFSTHIPQVSSHLIDGTTAMKFEAIISEESFIKAKQEMQKNYKRARDMVSAILTPPYNYAYFAKYITLIPLRGYAYGKQFIPEYLKNLCVIDSVQNSNTIESFVKGLLNDGARVRLERDAFAIDGVVVSEILDQSNHPIVNPENECAIKILTNVKETKLASIDYQFGKQGRITPVAILEPVQFENVTVDHVTLSTLQRVVDMQLRHNDTVRIMYNIVPYFLESYHDGDYQIPVPDKCPICGAKLDYLSYKLVRCSNPHCKGLKLGAIIRHAEKMKMVGLGEGVITKLYDNEFVMCIADLYDLRRWDDCIAQTPGFGWTSYENMVKSVDKALHEATLPQFLGALPFNDIDEKTWKQILTEIDAEKIIISMRDGTLPELLMEFGYIPNVGTLKIQKIVDGYLRHKEEVQTLMDLTKELKQVDYSYGKAGKICMTGTRDADLIQALTECGYEVGGWTNDCECVIVPSHDFTSAKTEKAKAKGIPIYTVKEAYDHLIKPF